MSAVSWTDFDVEERARAAIDAWLAMVDHRFKRELFEESLKLRLLLDRGGGDFVGARKQLTEPRLGRRKLTPRLIEERAELVDRRTCCARIHDSFGSRHDVDPHAPEP
jgi:hypothetical protein